MQTDKYGLQSDTVLALDPFHKKGDEIVEGELLRLRWRPGRQNSHEPCKTWWAIVTHAHCGGREWAVQIGEEEGNLRWHGQPKHMPWSLVLPMQRRIYHLQDVQGVHDVKPV